MSHDPHVKVGVEMPATLLARAKAAARARRTSVSEICRAGVIRELRLIEAELLAAQQPTE